MATLHQISVINHREVLNGMWTNGIAWPTKLPSSLMSSPSLSSSLGAPQTAVSGGNKRLFAVLIGINVYPAAGMPTLRGAVADALDFQNYLESYLAVPSDQITVLTNEQATRTAIIEALRFLGEDKRIENGDAILIYYAGHGTEMNAPAHWEPRDSMIQAIVPYDCDVEVSGKKISPIPDYTIGALLSRIAEKKGDNITVFFDCCHSASGTRGASVDQDPSELVRSAELSLSSQTLPDDLDKDIWDVGTRGGYVAPTYRTRGLGSHTLLAACGAAELAKEDRGHGRFSTSLLQLLRQISPENIRYVDILNHHLLPSIPGQNPQCEGLNKHRTLFNGKVLHSQRKSFPVRCESRQGRSQFVVDAGTLQGITKGSEFAVYRKSDIQSTKLLGVLVADTVTPFSTTASLPSGNTPFDLTHPTIAILTKSADKPEFRIKISPEDPIFAIIQDLLVEKNDFNHVRLVDGHDADAHVEIALGTENQVSVKMNMNPKKGNTTIASSINATQYIENDKDALAQVLSAASHFHGELTNSHDDSDISKNIQIEFHQLSQDGFGPEHLNRVGLNLLVGGEINIYDQAADGEHIPYGIRLANKSEIDLHANVFYFDPYDLSILTCATTHESGRHTLDVPLRRSGGSLTIGYGSGGYQPLSFYLEEGLNTEVGFFKIYLTTEPADISYIAQSSPFYSSRGMTTYKTKTKVSWTDIIVPIVHRRRFPLPEALT